MKNFFEMTETRANLNHLMDLIEFANYQIATGTVFTIGDSTSKEDTAKINNLTSDISHNLCEALDGITEILGIMSDSEKALPEEKERAEHGEPTIFLHEVCGKEEISHLQGATVLSLENIKFDGQDATEIIFKTKDGKEVEMVNTMSALLCSGEYDD